MDGADGSTVMADFSNDNALNHAQHKETDQVPSLRNPTNSAPFYNATPIAEHKSNTSANDPQHLSSTNHNPSSPPSQDRTDPSEHHIKLDPPSWPTFATHTTPDLKPIDRRSQIATAGIHRRLCFSLDEKALFDLHHRHQYSSTTTTSHQRSSGPSDQSPQRTAPEPIAPPYAPPKRTRTPDGVPSWPGALLLQQQQQRDARQQQQQERSTGNLMRRSSRRFARFFAKILDDRPGRRQNGQRARVRRIFGLNRYREEPQRNAAARWRPPISGHSTFRFDSLEAHPFSGPSLSDEPFVGVPVAGIRRRRRKVFSSSIESRRSVSEDLGGSESSHGSRVQVPRLEEGIPLSSNRRAMSQPNRSSNSSNSVIVSPSIRALAALRGLPLPLSPEQLQAETARRSSSIPRSRVRSPVNGLGSQRRFSYPTSTARTVDLIEAFPSPPSPRAPRSPRSPRSRHSAPARMSLFPVVAGLKERSGNVQDTSSPNSKKRLELLESVVESAKKRKRASASASSGPLQAIVFRVDNARSPSASNVWVSGALPEPSDHDGSVETIACSSSLVRGEDLDRYRHSGTPVYDRNTRSLCSVDETEDVDMAALLSHPATPTSGKTGMTRYFSAASQVGPNRNTPAASAALSTVSEPQKRCRSEHQVQRERAVANGALRFSSQAPSETASSGADRLSGHSAIVPVRTTSLHKACSHNVGTACTRRSVGRNGLDGTQESPDNSPQMSKWDVRCFRCELKRVVQRVAQLVRRRDQIGT